MLHELVPCRNRIVEVALVDVRDRARARERSDSRPGSHSRRAPLRSVVWPVAHLSVPRQPAERVHQPESAVVMPVVADEHVGRGRLRRGRDERRVGLDHSHHRLKPWIGDAVLPDLAVVVLHVLEQPFDRVVVVGALVGRAPLGVVGAHHHELPFGAELSADILKDEDEAFLVEHARRPELGAVLIRPVGRNRVGRAHHENGVGNALVFGLVDDGEELDPVAHRHHDLALRIVVTNIAPALRGAAPDEKRDSGDVDERLHFNPTRPSTEAMSFFES